MQGYVLHSHSFPFLMHTYERMCIEWMTHTLKGYLLNRHLLKGYVLKRYELMMFIDMHGMTFRYANNLLKNSAPKRLWEKSAVMARWAVVKNNKTKYNCGHHNVIIPHPGVSEAQSMRSTHTSPNKYFYKLRLT